MSNTNDQPDWDELPTRAMTPESDGGQGAAHQMSGQGQQPQQGAGQYGAQPAQDAAQQYGSQQQSPQNPYGQQGGQDGSQPQSQAQQPYEQPTQQQYVSQPQNGQPAPQYGAQPQGQTQQPYDQPTQQQYGAQPQSQQNPYGQQGGQYGSQPQTDQAAQQYGQQSQPGQPGQPGVAQPNQYGQPGQQNAYGSQQSSQYGSQNQPGQYGQGAPAYSQNQPGATQQFGQQYGQPTPATKVGTSGPKGLGAMASWAAVVLSALAILGSFGTWAHVKASSHGTYGRTADATANGLGSVSGTGISGHGDGYKAGWFIVVLALLAIAVAVLRALGKLPKIAGWGTAVAGLVITIIGFMKWNDIRGELNEAKDNLSQVGSGIDFTGSTGWGIILCLVAGVLLIVAGALSALRD